MTTQLVFAHNGQAVTTSEIVANGVGIEHKNILALVRTYQADFESFNPLAFETRKGKPLPQGGFAKGTVIAILSEQQATLLVTYCKNTEIVRKFKVALVKAFYEARQAQLPAPSSDTITNAQQVAIQQAVAHRAKKTAAHYQTIYRAIKTRYQIPRYTELPKAQYEDCMRFIQEVDLRVPEAPKAVVLPPSAPKEYVITERLVEQLRTFVYCQRYLFRESFDRYYAHLKSVDSPHAAMFWEAAHDLNLAALEASLEKIGFPVKELDCYKHWALTHTPA